MTLGWFTTPILYRSAVGLIIAACTLVVGGCMEQIKQQTQKQVRTSFLAAAQSERCCRSLAELDYEPLVSGQQKTYWHNENLAAIRIGANASHAKGFELDPSAVGKTLHIQTEIIGTFANAQTFMIPSLMILDEAFNVIDDEANIFFSEAEPAWFTDTRLEGDFRLEAEKHAAARYIVLYFDERSLQRSFTLCEGAKTSVVVVGTVVAPVMSGGRCLDMPAAPDGKLVLTLKP